MIRARLRNEDGMTLVELMAAMVSGVIVLLGAYALLDVAVITQKDADARVDMVARGRLAMEEVSRQVRSQICLDKTTVPIIEATPNKIHFYASLAAASDQTVFQKRTVEYVPAADGGPGRIDETVVDGVGDPPNVAFPGAPRTRTILTDVRPPAGWDGIFRFYAFEALSAPQMREVTAPIVPEGERRLTVQVRIAFEVRPRGGRNPRQKILFDNNVYVRTADPTDPTRSPKCT